MAKYEIETTAITELDAVIVGAGFAGLYMLHKLRGMGLRVRVYEAGQGVGGTWYWNRYPGARCDVQSMEYSYSFSRELQQDWKWSERYSGQPEILRYINHVADRFDLRRDVQLETRIEAAVYDEDDASWTLSSEQGELIRARYCIMATGCLSVPRAPEVTGLETFQGSVYHTGEWPHEGVDFRGQRVAVLGTGSSGIQSIPQIAEQAARLYVLQRTPNFSVPAMNGPLDPAHERYVKEHYDEIRSRARKSFGGTTVEVGPASALAVSDAEREKHYDERWGGGGFGLMFAYADLMVDASANQTAAAYVRQKIRGIVADPEVATLLSPTDHPIGTKRICVDTNYYETFNRKNVELVDLRKNPLERITEKGVRIAGRELLVDSVVLATGFDAMTGALLKIDIRGRDDQSLRDKWEDGPRSYLGLQVAGFPNLFTITGPGSPSVLTNMLTSIEHHVDWIAEAIVYGREYGLVSMEAELDAEDAWVEHVLEIADKTLYPSANSWYLGANVPGKPRVFMPYVGGLHAYIEKCEQVVQNDYQGFRLRSQTPRRALRRAGRSAPSTHDR